MEERARYQSDDPLGTLILIYLVLDESGSMEPDIGVLNEGILSFWDAFDENPMASARIRLSIIGFSDEAIMYQEPANLCEIEEVPELVAKGRTMYGKAFALVRERLEVDVEYFAKQGYEVDPFVFFFTDGAPNDKRTWKTEYDRLVDPQFPYRPKIWPLGFGEANDDVIRAIANYEGWVNSNDGGLSTAEILKRILPTLINSVIKSGIDVARGNMPEAAREGTNKGTDEIPRVPLFEEFAKQMNDIANVKTTKA